MIYLSIFEVNKECGGSQSQYRYIYYIRGVRWRIFPEARNEGKVTAVSPCNIYIKNAL